MNGVGDSTGPMTGTTPGKLSVLAVCLGNICRSPTAEAVLQSLIEKEGADAGCIVVDSCGTGGGNPNWYKDGGWSYHEGDAADSRMQETASRRGIHLTSTSRPLSRADLETFDVIIAMDTSNVAAIKEAAAYWGEQYAELASRKVRMMMDFHSDPSRHGTAVPDPYYSGLDGFELVLDLLEDSCRGLLASLRTLP
ncbi:putative low molecular weight protein-tyrosine-phosphatase [Porphyridium purpureum]|uniref:Putative low molecular weight protein-tyrosine-phosphatase n=1 Tax=Porphyridium purpureum TaxID=35688 RepID=A0A5J4YZR8_PORPP|nr:putative low molecular weight protein-tyrosine-phosphatase [Porphyridium purpureum]|eukprot:POR6951..scf209_3